MELTIDQALQKAISAHKAGQVQEADRYYTAILKLNPTHSDANHNMGVLAVGLGKLREAIPFFQNAVKAKPSIAQYWLSYINVLIKLDRRADAMEVLEQAKSEGVEGNKFDLLETQLRSSASETLNAQNPSQDQLQSLVKLYAQAKYEEVLVQAKKLLQKFPDFAELANIIGAANKGLGKLDEAVLAYKKALSIKPNFADAYNNLGNVYKEQGQLDKALEAYKKAISIKPDYAEAYNNMGLSLHESGNRIAAVEAYKKALSIKPDYADAYNNMGNVFKERGELNTALEAYTDALAIKSDYADAHNNKGATFLALGERKKALESFSKAISIRPNFVNAYNNMGFTLDELDKSKEALGYYAKALSIKPNYAEAYNNLGNTLKKQGKLEEAIEAYNKAISLKPDYAKAYNNIGKSLNHQGKFQEAIKAYKNALAIEPDYVEVWNNLYFPMKAIKFHQDLCDNLDIPYPQNVNSNFGKILLNILDYRLHRGLDREEVCFFNTMKSLLRVEDTIIQNEKFQKLNATKQPLPEKMVALVHFGRSGTGLMHSLIDGHSEVSTLPSIYFSEYFDHSVWTWITADGWEGMIDRFITMYEVLFDAKSPVPVSSKSKKLIHNVGIKDGMANVGLDGSEVLTVDKKKFRSHLKNLLSSYSKIDPYIFFKLVHLAYDKALGRDALKNVIFYHIHNPDTYAQLNFASMDPSVNWLIMIREPIQSCESWVNKAFLEYDYNGIVNGILTMLFQIDDPIYVGENTIGVRLEDLKTQPKKTISLICNLLGIGLEDSLYEMTAQGKKWWGDPSSPDFLKDGMQPFGTTSINREIGSVFSENDQLILRTLFYPFSVKFGYIEDNKNQFMIDLETIKPRLKLPFDFEIAIIKATDADPELFMKSGAYLLLRSCLNERWNTLKKFGTYPKMLRPLNI